SSAERIVDTLLEQAEGTRFQLLAPVMQGRKGEHAELLSSLRSQGYARARVDGEVRRLDEEISLDKKFKHTIEVIVDRLAAKPDSRRRLTDSVETALRLAEGILVVDFVDLEADDPGRTRRFSEKRACPNDHPLAIDDIEPRTFSFNAPYGACPECAGIGMRLEVDPELVIPDEDLTLAEGAIAPWAMGSADRHQEAMAGLSEGLNSSMDTTSRNLPERAREALLHGKDYKVHVKYRNRFGRERTRHRLRGRHALPRASPLRHRVRLGQGALRAVHAGGALPHLQGGAAAPRGARRDRRRPLHRRGHRHVHPGRADLPPGAGAGGAGGRHRRRGAAGDPLAPGLPARRRPGLPDHVPRRRHPVRRRGPAHPPGHPDRLRSGRCAVRARRAVDRPAP